MLVIESDGALNGVVTDGIAVREILGDDARAGLVFLRDVMLIMRGVVC